MCPTYNQTAFRPTHVYFGSIPTQEVHAVQSKGRTLLQSNSEQLKLFAGKHVLYREPEGQLPKGVAQLDPKRVSHGSNDVYGTMKAKFQKGVTICKSEQKTMGIR